LVPDAIGVAGFRFCFLRRIYIMVEYYAEPAGQPCLL